MDDDTRLALFSQLLRTSIKYTVLASVWMFLMESPGFSLWMHSLTGGRLVLASLTTMLFAWVMTSVMSNICAGIVVLIITTRRNPDLDSAVKRKEFLARAASVASVVRTHMTRINYGLAARLAIFPLSYLLLQTRDVVFATSILLGFVAADNYRARRVFNA